MKTKLIPVLIPLLFSLIFAPPGHAISVKEEKDLSKEILSLIHANYPLVKDPVINNYINELGNKILSHVPSQPFKYRFYVVREDVYNAFAIPAGQIFINSGLFEALETEEELAGILAHEIAHAVCRHISQRIEQSKKLNLATMAGVLAGVFLGAGGAATAGNAVVLGTMATSQTMALSYTRENEMQADQLGLHYLKDAGYSGAGLLTSLEIIRSKQWFGSDQVPTYLMTHPASEDRMAYIDSWMARNEKNGATPARKSVQPMAFRRAHTRLVALYGDVDTAATKFQSALEKKPGDPMMHYGYGLALARGKKYDQAESQLKKALGKNALDPYFLAALGNVYFHQGRYEEAVQTLEGAVSLAEDEPEALFLLGRAQIEAENLTAAAATLEKLVKLDSEYDRAHYFLGEVYGKQGNMPEAHYNLGLYYDKKRDSKNAVFHLQRASKEITDPEKQKRIKELLEKNRKLYKEHQKKKNQ